MRDRVQADKFSMNNKQKVLIVDDEPRNIRIITEILEDMVEMKTARSGEETLEVLQNYRPDLVLLDIMMPGIDGYEVCRRIREQPRMALTKIILVSGKAMLDERLLGYSAGADDYMTKPFVPEELLAKAKVFLRLTAMERQAESVKQGLEEKVEERTQELFNTEAKLITAAKMAALGEMAGGIAHEINTPLSTVRMVAEQIEELVQDAVPDVKMIMDKSRVISNTVQRISAIILGLRTFSRDGSNDRLDWAPVHRVVSDTIALCGEKIKYNSITLDTSGIAADLHLHCRPVQISQVLLNLISNACDAIAERDERWVKVSAERKNGSIFISVTDSGAGISEKVREKLFQPFFTTKEIGKGTGLGLSISRGILEAHHGNLSIDATCPNTRFVIQIPEGAAPVASVPLAPKAA